MTGVIDWFRVGYAILHERANFRDLPLSPVFYLFLPESVNRFLLLFFSRFIFPMVKELFQPTWDITGPSAGGEADAQ